MGLDVGGFIGSLQRDNDMRAKCRTCGRDKRLKGKISPNTNVLQRCRECGEPMVWTKTGHSGEQEEWEWLAEHGKAVQRKKSKGFRISID